MWDKVQTILLVTVISLLVWLYAEGEAVTQRSQQIEVRFVSPPGQQLAIEPAESQLVEMTFQGSRGQINELQRRLAEGPIEIALSEIPEGSETIPQTINLRDELAATAIGEIGINIQETDPPTVTLRTEHLVTRTMDVEARAADALFERRPDVEPDRVEVTMPVSLAPYAENLTMLAPLPGLAQLEVGEAYRIDVRVRPPAALDHPWVSVEPDRVEVAFTIREQTDTLTLTSVPIHLSAPPLLLQRYEIALRDEDMVLRDVAISGPGEVIERIRRGETRVWAELRPTADDLDAGVESLPVQMQLPAGVTLESELAEIPVEVSRRDE